MKYIVTLDIEVEDGNIEEDVRRAIEGVASQAQHGEGGVAVRFIQVVLPGSGTGAAAARASAASAAGAAS